MRGTGRGGQAALVEAAATAESVAKRGKRERRRGQCVRRKRFACPNGKGSFYFTCKRDLIRSVIHFRSRCFLLLKSS